MKKYVPFKYILGMIAMFFIFPVLLILIMIFTIGLNNLTIVIIAFSSALVASGPIVYIINQENACIIIKNKSITNYINDGTLNFGWTKEIESIKEIELVDNYGVKKHFKNCKARKVLLFKFGLYEYKYISVSLFTNNQINQIIKHLKKGDVETGDTSSSPKD